MAAKNRKRAGIDRGSEAVGLVFIFIGAFAAIALFTYNHLDPSFFNHVKRLPLNYGGQIGATLAEALFQAVGLGAFILVGQLFFSGLYFFDRNTILSIVGKIFWQFGSVFSAAAFLGIHFRQIEVGGGLVSAGGFLGQELALYFLKWLNLWGATLFCLLAFLLSIAFSTPITLGRIWSALRWVGGEFAAGAEFLISIRQRKRAERLIVEKLKSTKVVQKPQIVAKEATPKISIEVEEVQAKPKKAVPKASNGNQKPITEFQEFHLPPLDLLNAGPTNAEKIDHEILLQNSRLLEAKLTDFGIQGQVVAVRPGPVITMYEVTPGPGVKISQIANLADDLSLALSAQSVRIVAPIPGKSVVGIEIPNEKREKVVLQEILATEPFQKSQEGIPLAIGKDISGSPVIADLARMPHLLIAGAPGAGKSVFINSLICSLLYKFTPRDLQLIMVDPKQLELNLYEGIPHLLLPIVDDPKKASNALKWAVNEMERRYKILARAGVRNILGYNEKRVKDGEEKMRSLLCPQDDAGMPQPNSLSHLFEFDQKGLPTVPHMPYILIIIDEFADLMMVAPKDIETSVARLAQKARAAGIHLVIATQRPSVDVITGLIKANLPSRISFKVASKVDSRTILDGIGAEKLLGHGDLLFVPPGLSRLVRLHGALVTEEEIEKIHDHWCAQGAPVYREEILEEVDEAREQETPDGASDTLYQEALTIVRELGQASASMLQRRLKVGYNRAARMVEAMEAQGIVGPADGAKPRDVLL